MSTNNKLFNKYVAVLKTGCLSERDIVNLRSVIAGSRSAMPGELRTMLKGLFYDLMPTDGYKITVEQSNKGIEFLREYCFKTNGDLRKQASSLGERELTAIKEFKEFTLTELYNPNYAVGSNYTYPVYTVWTKDGHGFDYYYNGQLNVVG